MMLTADITVSERLRAFSMFAALDSRRLDELSKLVVCKHYGKGESIISSGDESDGMYLLLRGRVKIALTSLNAKELALEYVEAPASFGEMGFAGGSSRAADVYALTDVEVASLPPSQMSAALEIYPGLAMVLLTNLSRTTHVLLRRLEDIAFNDAGHRVMRVVLNVATVSYEARGIPLIEGLTHYEIATLAGTSRETASRVISRLGRDGVLRTKGRKIIVDILKLEDLLRVS